MSEPSIGRINFGPTGPLRPTGLPTPGGRAFALATTSTADVLVRQAQALLEDARREAQAGRNIDLLAQAIEACVRWLED